MSVPAERSITAEKGGAGFAGIKLLLCENQSPPLDEAVAAAADKLSEAIRSSTPPVDLSVFFANAATSRGSVVYCRYDGHYGLITPE